MIPETLEAWTLETIRTLLSQGVHENERLEFKEMVSGDQKGKLRLRKAIAAFANSGGGFLVIGIRDDRSLPAEERMEGRSVTEDVPEHFGALARECEPSVDWDFANPPLRLPTGNVIHVLQIEASKRGPHGIFDGDKICFPKRTNQGTQLMTYAELRAAFVDQRRRDVLRAQLRLELARVRDFADRRSRERYANTFGVVPADLYIERYRPQQIETIIVQFLDEAGPNADLVMYVRQLVEAAYAADEGAQQLANMLSLVSDHDVLNERIATLGNSLQSYARRVMDAAKDALKLLVPTEKP